VNKSGNSARKYRNEQECSMAESADDTRSADGRHGPKAPAIHGEKLLSVEDRMKAHSDDLAHMLKPELPGFGRQARQPVGRSASMRLMNTPWT
jgi:hypothetical protein